MTKTAIATRLLPVAIVAAVLGASLIVRPVGINALNTALCGYGYGYGTVPAVDSVAPNQGSTAGGTGVTITGCGFTGATAVKFGGTTASFNFVSDTKITAVSPAHTAAPAADVTVTTPLGTSPTNPGDEFEYIAPNSHCTSAAVSPASGTF